MNRPNKLDWLIYSIFRWWWNPIFQGNPKLAEGFIKLFQMYLKDNNIEQQLEDEKRRSQAIIDLLDEALVKIGLDPNSYTVAGKIDMLMKYAQQGVQATLLQCDFTDCQEPVHSMLCKEHYYESQSG